MKQLNAPTIRPLNHESIHTMGRGVWRNNEALFSYPGVTFEFTIQADSFAIDVQPYKGKGRLDVYFDGTLRKQLIIKSAQQHSFKLNSANKPIQVQLVNRGETWHGIMQIKGLIIDNGALLNPPNVRLHKLLFIGDSVTCGALLNRNPKGNKGPHLSDSYHSFGMQIGRKLNDQVHLIGYGGRGILRSRSEEHTPELQSRQYLGCRLLLEKKKIRKYKHNNRFNQQCRCYMQIQATT